ncbi:MAG: hypothetical protein VYD95_03815, partial [Pseudomonadota bacterium]|nr:hypothetical protein [Pseudomonadota bacterium]
KFPTSLLQPASLRSMSSRLLSIASNINVFTQVHYSYPLIALEVAIIVIIFYLRHLQNEKTNKYLQRSYKLFKKPI